MQERELSIIVSVVGWVLAGVGGLIAIVGGLIGYIFIQHKSDNDCDSEDIRAEIGAVRNEILTNIQTVTKEIKESIVRVHERIDNHIEAD